MSARPRQEKARKTGKNKKERHRTGDAERDEGMRKLFILCTSSETHLGG